MESEITPEKRDRKVKNVIPIFKKKPSDKKKEEEKGEGKKNFPVRVIAVTSGKGGVGKTSVVANLAYALAKMNKKILVLDADLSLANLDVSLGIVPRFNLHHVFLGEKRLSDIIVTGPGGMKIIPASSGVQELSELNEEQRLNFMEEIDLFDEEVDMLLIDTGAGISSNVMYFNAVAQDIIVVTSPEPTALTDAYALMKVMSLKYQEKNFKLLVNSVKSGKEAKEIFQNLSSAAEKFLPHLSIDYLGYILFDQKISLAIRQQRTVLDIYPNAQASKCFCTLAEKVSELFLTVPPQKGNIKFFWRDLLANARR